MLDLGLAILCGLFVGFALGLTGGGGGIFAVPLLVYGLQVAPREAIGISLAAVGGTALLGAIPRWKQGYVEMRTGMIFAIGGMAGAPLGTWLSSLLPEWLLLISFSGLMVVVAYTMWRKARELEAGGGLAVEARPARRGPCQRDADGRLRRTPACITLLAALGLATGILSGLYGVGGGFVIVPALVLLSGMPIHHAIATSLMVIFLVSISGVSSYLLGGSRLSWQLTGLFILGGFAGMQLGSALSKRLSGPRLQRVFAVAVVLVALFVVAKSVTSVS